MLILVTTGIFFQLQFRQVQCRAAQLYRPACVAFAWQDEAAGPHQHFL